jgi:hypothetical protein
MREATHKDTGIPKLMRWVTLFCLIGLLMIPHIRQGESEAQTTCSEKAGSAFAESGREMTSGILFRGQQTDWDEEYGQAFPKMDLGVVLEKFSIPGMPEPGAPGEDSAASVVSGSASSNVGILNTSREDDAKSAQEPGNPYDGIIQKAAQRYEVDPALVKAIIMAESSYNPKAVSRRGAQGLMQLMPRTARALGVEDSFDPKDNIEGGVRYFKQLLEQFDGNLKLAIAAYNAGSRKVRMYKGLPPFKHTRYYVAKVMEYHQRYQQ